MGNKPCSPGITRQQVTSTNRPSMRLPTPVYPTTSPSARRVYGVGEQIQFPPLSQLRAVEESTGSNASNPDAKHTVSYIPHRQPTHLLSVGDMMDTRGPFIRPKARRTCFSHQRTPVAVSTGNRFSVLGEGRKTRRMYPRDRRTTPVALSHSGFERAQHRESNPARSVLATDSPLLATAPKSPPNCPA
eukprot:GHVQ01018221.1.p2 GENE.GHVQ01018221.1~~GHVQ01018221.1.p2  ORF type:complete len:188 (+),score=17.55 GHVQ01018221.1:227-790(+)